MNVWKQRSRHWSVGGRQVKGGNSQAPVWKSSISCLPPLRAPALVDIASMSWCYFVMIYNCFDFWSIKCIKIVFSFVSFIYAGQNDRCGRFFLLFSGPSVSLSLLVCRYVCARERFCVHGCVSNILGTNKILSLVLSLSLSDVRKITYTS